MITVVATSPIMDHRTKEHTGPLKFPSLDFFFFSKWKPDGYCKAQTTCPLPFNSGLKMHIQKLPI